MLRYDAALEAQNGLHGALDNRAIALLDLGRHEAAAGAFRQLLAASPAHDYARGRLFHAERFCCDWRDAAASSGDIQDRVARGERADLPFTFLAHAESAALQLACATSFVAGAYEAAEGRAATPAARDRIHLAYLSADFRAHPTSLLMAGIFELHDRARFEVTAISFRPPEDSPIGRRVHAAFDRFLDVGRQSDAEVAAMMLDLGVDVAVDLMGHTANSRTGILALRPAAVQVNYLGYPGTMGAPFIDAIVADDFVVPPGSERFYTERVVRLPLCFQANDDRCEADPAPARAAAGLPQQGFVFCAFGNTFKLGPDLFASFMRLLDAVPGSVLWLVAEEPLARTNLAREAVAHGIDPARLAFAPRVAYPAHLARLRLADLFLDTYPFNGGTTVSDALRAGVPVVTRAGEAFASRMAGSLLRAAGLADLVTADMAEFEALARRLALDPAALASARTRLDTRRLFDTAQTARALEAAYEELHHARR